MGLFDEQISRKPNNYPWTADFIKAMHQGHWTVNEFTFASDLHDFKVSLSEKEKDIITKTLSAVAQIEVAVKKFWARLGDNLPHPSIVDLGYVMANIEVIHNEAYEKLLSVLDMEDIFDKNLLIEVFNNRVQYLRKYNEANFKDRRKQYIYSIILFTLFIENVSLFSQFYIINWFGRFKNVLKDTCQQTDYTRREECYIDGTECLTPYGWKKISEMSIGDDVYQYNSDGSLSLTTVNNTTSRLYKGSLVQFKKQGHLCVVTPKHDMVYYDKNNFLKKKTANNLKLHKEVKIPLGGLLTGGNIKNLTWEDRLRLAIQADGHVTKWTDGSGNTLRRGVKNGYTHSIVIKKTRKIERLKLILENIDNIPFEISGPDSSGFVQFKIKYYNSECDYKDFSWVSLSDKSSEWCNDFINELSEWDGYKIPDSDRFGYSSTNKYNIDIAQVIGILAGKRTKIIPRIDDRKESYKICYRLNFTNSNLTPISHAIKKSEIEYEGLVSCISVESGMIITRYKDNTFIAGNCLHFQAGAKIINTLRQEYPELFDYELEEKIIKEAHFAFDCESKIIDWIIGDYQGERINADVLKEYIKYKLNEGITAIGYKKLYEIDDNLYRDFEWMNEETIGNMATDFFHKRPTEYNKSKQSYDEDSLFG